MKLYRLAEVFVALALILLFFPLTLLIAITIKISSKGPIFFSSPRIGCGGKTFDCFKFRTMETSPGFVFHEWLLNNPEKKLEWETFHKLQNDPRITPIGKILRKTSLDELPQLLNVLNGSMSLIGPRPLLAEDLLRIPETLKSKFLSIKPGITGLWQISGRNAICFSKRVEIESYYIDQKNLWLDIKILFKTIPVVLFKKGAY